MKYYFVSYVERRPRELDWRYANWVTEGSPARWALQASREFGVDHVVLYAEEITKEQYEYFKDWEYLNPEDNPDHE